MQYYGEIKYPYMTIWMNITDKIKRAKSDKKEHIQVELAQCVHYKKRQKGSKLMIISLKSGYFGGGEKWLEENKRELLVRW